MTTAVDTRFKQLASRLLSNYGKTVKWTRLEAGAYDSASSSATSKTSSSWIKVTLSNFSRGEFFAAGGLILGGDMKLLVTNVFPAPKPGDEFSIDGVTWRAIAVENTWSGDDVALHAVQVRR